jgi:hypothetical protein
MMKRIVRNMRTINNIKMIQIKIILILSFFMMSFLIIRPSLSLELLNETITISTVAIVKRNRIKR